MFQLSVTATVKKGPCSAVGLSWGAALLHSEHTHMCSAFDIRTSFSVFREINSNVVLVCMFQMS